MISMIEITDYFRLILFITLLLSFALVLIIAIGTIATGVINILIDKIDEYFEQLKERCK